MAISRRSRREHEGKIPGAGFGTAAPPGMRGPVGHQGDGAPAGPMGPVTGHTYIPPSSSPNVGSVGGPTDYSNLHFASNGLSVGPGGGGDAAHRQAAQAVAQHRAIEALLGSLTPAQQALAPMVMKASQLTGYPASLLMAQLGQESSWGENIGPSSTGAQGVSQFMPETAQNYGVEVNDQPPYGSSAGDPKHSIWTQIYGQARLMSDLMKEHNNNVPAALGGYYGEEDPAYYEPIIEGAKQFEGLDKANAGGGHQALHSGFYTYPFSHSDNLYVSRTDMGKDFSGEGPIQAIGKAKILSTGAPGWPEEGGVLYKLLKGPAKGRTIFTYEGVDPTVEPGEVVKKGETIANFRPGGSIETGFATPTGEALAAPYYNEGDVTPPGEKMSAWLERLSGKPSAPLSGSTTPVGYSPTGYAGSAGSTPTTSSLMSAALNHAESPGSAGIASPGGGTNLSSVLGFLSSPVPDVSNPYASMVGNQNDPLTLALRRRLG